VITEPGKTPFSRPRKTYSGKTGGQNDDLVISLQMAVAGARCFFTNEKYKGFRG
jgi:hypothetical protein